MWLILIKFFYFKGLLGCLKGIPHLFYLASHAELNASNYFGAIEESRKGIRKLRLEDVKIAEEFFILLPLLLELLFNWFYLD